MNHLQHCDALEESAQAFVRLVDGSDPAAPVPTCPGWTLADLIAHTGTLYRWSAAHVATGARARIPQDTLDLGPAEDRADPAWVAAGIEPMMTTFHACDPEAAVWGWGADRHSRFWPRRMLFETVIHGADAAAALGVTPSVSTDVAVDGVDELLANIPHAAYFATGLAELRGDGERIALVATDTGVAWQVRLFPNGYSWDWAPKKPHATLTATSADLLLGIYQRTPVSDAARFERGGDVALIDRLLTGLTL